MVVKFEQIFRRRPKSAPPRVRDADRLPKRSSTAPHETHTAFDAVQRIIELTERRRANAPGRARGRSAREARRTEGRSRQSCQPVTIQA